MLSWYCIQLWRLLLFTGMMLVSGGWICVGADKGKLWAIGIGLIVGGSAWLLILLPTIAGGGGA